MENKEAIERLKDHMRVHRLSDPQAYFINIAHKMAIDALERQNTEPDPKPLTLEQLREMDGKPVFIINKSNHPENNRSCWEIISTIQDEILYLKGAGKYCYRLDNYATLDKYGKTWLAYDREVQS